MTSTATQEAFLHLVRLGIGHTDCIDFTNKVDWVQLKALADEQGLSAVILDGIDKANTNLTKCTNDLPVQIKLEWIGEVVRDYEQRYVQYEKALGSFAGWYNQHGYKMMVLKGYACSLNWPKPNHRPCGDIDIWLFGKQKEADALLAKEKGIVVDNSHHHHTVFNWCGFTVENHYDFVNVHHNKSNASIENVFKEIGQDDTHFVDIDGADVYLPSANLHALFLLRHSMIEFAATGINIRQILDWAFFWKVEYKNVDISWLMGVVEKHGMKDFFHIINKICVEDMGFDRCIFPKTESKKEYLKEMVLNECLSPEYDKRAAHQNGMIKRVIYKYRRWKAGSWKRDLCYKEGDLESFLWSVRMHLLKPSSI